MNVITSHSAAGIGDNSGATLADILAEETADLEARAKNLAAAAGRAAVTDEETAGKATLLAKMIREHRSDIDKARVARKEPYLVAGRTVDQHFGYLDKLLAETDGKGKVIGGPLASVIGMVDAYRRDQEAKAAAERRRLEEEARKQREAAEAAERARREAEAKAAREAEEAQRKIREAEAAARAAGDAEAAAKAAQARAEEESRQAAAREASLRAEIEARQAQEQAEALQRQAEQVKATPIDSGFGAKASGRTTYKAEIIDLTAALKHALKVDKASVQTAVQAIYDHQVKAGVRELPGATVTAVTSTVIR